MKKTAAIIGGGVIGGGWAARFVLNGWNCRVFDPDPEAERKIAEVLANARRSLPGLTDVALPSEGVISFYDSIQVQAGSKKAYLSGLISSTRLLARSSRPVTPRRSLARLHPGSNLANYKKAWRVRIRS